MLPGRKADRRLHPFDLDHDRCGRENSATMSITPQELQKLFDERKPTEELVNFCFAEYLQDFNKNNASSFPEQTLGLLKFKDRICAERTLEWVKSRVLKGANGQVPDV
jgi:hypothetical protein